jgi:hypothetical protein
MVPVLIFCSALMGQCIPLSGDRTAEMTTESCETGFVQVVAIFEAQKASGRMPADVFLYGKECKQ